MKKIIKAIETKIVSLEYEAEEQIQDLNNQEECNRCLYLADELKEILKKINKLQNNCQCVIEKFSNGVEVTVVECEKCKNK